MSFNTRLLRLGSGRIRNFRWVGAGFTVGTHTSKKKTFQNCHFSSYFLPGEDNRVSSELFFAIMGTDPWLGFRELLKRLVLTDGSDSSCL